MRGFPYAQLEGGSGLISSSLQLWFRLWWGSVGSRLVVSKANLTQLWLGLLLVFREAVVFTGDVVVDSLVSLS